MKKFLVKEIALYGRTPNPGDKYIDPPPGPIMLDVQCYTYPNINKYLQENGYQIIPSIKQEHPPSGWAPSSGWIWNLEYSCYVFNKCLVGNMIDDYNDWRNHGIKHSIIVGAAIEHSSLIDETISKIRSEAWLDWPSYWKKEDDRTFEHKGKLEDLAKSLFGMPRLLGN